jgi:hypothetical protein
MRQLFIKAPRSESLAHFASQIAVMSRSSPWEERDSVNYPEGRYFRQRFGALEIVAQVADDTEYPTADFLVWIRAGEDSSGHMTVLADALVQRGYALLDQNSN